MWLSLAICCLTLALGGCSGRLGGEGQGDLELTYGRRGISEGRFQKPRAMTIGQDDQIYVVDMTARIQVFTTDGEFLRQWQLPEFSQGKPSGLSMSSEGNLLVADTHYHRILTYTPEGLLLPEKTLGGEPGEEPGQFGLVTDVVVDSTGAWYVAEYGSFDRIQKFAPDGTFLFQWGGHGSELGEFLRPQNLAIDEKDHLWVVDACNHRIQVFDATGDQPVLVRHWGEQGDEPGKLNYPYDLLLDGQGHLYVCEHGNSRVQKFTLEGESLGCWGIAGRQEGELFNPWALTQDNQGRIHVLDTGNHRIHRIRM